MDPSFQYKKIRTLVPLFARCVSNLIQKWERQKQQPLKVEEDLTRMTLDAMGFFFPSSHLTGPNLLKNKIVM